MNELLQKHGCANVFSVPEGLKELMSDISREVLRAQPPDITDFIANYLSVLLITREHGVMAVKILDELCDCKPSVTEHLTQIGLKSAEAEELADIIKEEIEATQQEQGKETIKEYQIIKKILARKPLDEIMIAKVCQIARNAYRDYWYRKKTMEKSIKIKPDEPWEVAAQHTLELYKRTKPSFSELTRATEKIQAAYRGYYVRRNILRHLKPKTRKQGPKVELPGPPLDIGGSREIDWGPIINIKIHEDNIHAMFEEHTTQSLGLPYDPMRTITHVKEEDFIGDYPTPRDRASRISQISSHPGDNLSRLSGIPSQMAGDKMSHTAGIAQMSMSSHVKSVTSQHIEDRRPSQPAAEGRPSRLHSIAEPATLKISFSAAPQVITDDTPEGDQEIKEVLAPGSAEQDGNESDVPEDIADDLTEEDYQSVPASAPSSAPDTATTTDVEDEATDLDTSQEDA